MRRQLLEDDTRMPSTYYYATNTITVCVVQQIQNTLTQHNKSEFLYLQILLIYLSAVFEWVGRFWHMHNEVYVRDAYQVYTALDMCSYRNEKTCIVHSPLVYCWNATIKSAQASVKPGVGHSSETGTSARQSSTVCVFFFFWDQNETNNKLYSIPTVVEKTHKNNQEGPVHHASSQRRLRKPGQTSTRITAMDGMRDVHERPYSIVGYSNHRYWCRNQSGTSRMALQATFVRAEGRVSCLTVLSTRRHPAHSASAESSSEKNTTSPRGPQTTTKIHRKTVPWVENAMPRHRTGNDRHNIIRTPETRYIGREKIND